MSNNYNQVVDMLRACANYISENAQNMVGDTVNRCRSITVTIDMPDDIEAVTLTLIGGTFRNQISVHAFLVKGVDHVTIETKGTDRMIASYDERKDGAV